MHGVEDVNGVIAVDVAIDVYGVIDDNGVD